MCLTPYTLTDGNIVPCGKCVKCKTRRVSAWSFRLQQESRNALRAMFLTLTYNNEQFEKQPNGERSTRLTNNGFKTLSKRDVQLFLKRLRYYSGKQIKPIKYYLAGEYGSRTQRPHYHLILFNVERNLALINKAWGLGNVHIGDLTAASIGYTLKYISKGRTVPRHRNDDRLPEFQLTSKGLGATYITPGTIKYHRNDLMNRVCLDLEMNKKASMPRYYKDRIYSAEDKEKIKEHYQEMYRKLEKELNDEIYNQIRSEDYEEYKAAKALHRKKVNETAQAAKNAAKLLSNNKDKL